MIQFGLICEDPHRTESFKQALKACSLPPPRHLTYRQCLSSDDLGVGYLEGADILRLDSPGGEHATWSAISEVSGFKTEAYANDFGKLFPLAPFVTGFGKIINTVTHAVKAQTTYDPGAVLLFMDKRRTHAMCKSQGFPVPKELPQVSSGANLMLSMSELGIRHVFLKLRYGSAASGVLAIEKQGHHIRVLTTVERKIRAGQVYLYNSLKIQKYLDEEALQLIDDILEKFDVHIEEWLPKLRLNNSPTDLRVLFIGGQPAHVVVRCSQSPITNLHLGNQRFSIDALSDHIPNTSWNRIWNIGSKIAALYPKQFCFGLDIGIHNKTKEVFIIEINAFGDHLNHVTFNGMDPYTYQIRALEKIYAGR